MLLTFLLAAALWNCNCWWNAANIYTFAVQPGYLDFDNLPDTNFSCDGKVIGGYYADVETGCQMFHVCTIGQKAEITDIKFLCLNGTVFDQETRVCERLDEVDCSRSESFFDLNLELYGNNGAGYGIAPEDPPEQEPVRCDADEEDCSGTSDYFEEEVTTVAVARPAPATAATTTSTTTMTPVTMARTTAQPTTVASLTTSTRKPPAAVMPTSTGKPPAVSYPTNSPETIAALIALHNAFQESLKDREQGPGSKGQQSHRYPPPQQQPKPFTVTNFQPPRHFPSKPSSTPPPYRHQDPAHPVLLSSERFGNQDFRHGFRLQNGPQSYQQQQYDGNSYDEDADDEESRRNFAREAPEASVSVSVQVSSSSSKNSAIDQQQEQQQERLREEQQEQLQEQDKERQQRQKQQQRKQDQRQRQQEQDQRQQEQEQRQQEQQQRQQEQRQRLQEQQQQQRLQEQQQQQQRQHATTAATATTPKNAPQPSSQPSSQEPPPPPFVDDVESGDIYEDEYEELEGDEEFFKDVPKLGRNRRRKRSVGDRLWRA